MNKIRIPVLIFAFVFLSAAMVYSQELTEKELGILYDSAEWELNHYKELLSEDITNEELNAIAQEFLTLEGITAEQLEDIIARGLTVPLSSAEEQVAQELKGKYSEDLAPEEILAICQDLAKKYNMRVGQIASIIGRAQTETTE